MTSRVDNFYTKYPEVFIDAIDKYIHDDDILIEPSCGDGRFCQYFEFNMIFDIFDDIKDDTLKSIFHKQDFLKSDLPQNAVFIGNPPFGKNAQLAIKFIQKCCESNARLICFILPEVFRNLQVQNKAFSPYYHLEHEEAYNEFEQNGKNISVSCVFQIWIKKSVRRSISKEETQSDLSECKYFTYYTKKEIKDLIPNERTLSIRRVGSKTPEITKGIHPSLEDHFIIQLNEDIDPEEFIESYNKINFIISPSTKQRHINKKDLNKQVNEHIAL